METITGSFEAELARANLFRLRGDYDAAEQQCLGLLDRTPHDPTVSSLLGDIAAERDQLESAVRWYEVALDADAGHGIADKLASIKGRIKERDDAKAERSIGLEQKIHVPPMILVSSAVVAFLLIAAAYMAGVSQHNQAQALVQQPPIIIPQDQPITPISNPTPAHSVQSPEESQPTTPAQVIDPDLQAAFNTPDSNLAKVTLAQFDPRTKTALITASAAPSDDARKLAAAIAVALYAKVSAVGTITLRITQNGKLTYTADAPRSGFATDADSTAKADPTSGLTNEWPPVAEPQGNLGDHAP